MERTFTELGICDTFNSELTPYFAPTFLITNRLPRKMPIYQINYLDANAFAMINGMDGSEVSFECLQKFRTKCKLNIVF